jgi:hypothetical protein
MELSGRLHAPAALLPGRNLGTRWMGGWVGPRDGVDVFKEKKVSCPCRDSNPGLSSALLLGPVVTITTVIIIILCGNFVGTNLDLRT